jgi:hypothetical protein
MSEPRPKTAESSRQASVLLPVLEFLRRHAPFDRMAPEHLEFLDKRLQLTFYAQDEKITDPDGGPARASTSSSLDEYFRRFVPENQGHMTETELARRLGISRKALWEPPHPHGHPPQGGVKSSGKWLVSSGKENHPHCASRTWFTGQTGHLVYSLGAPCQPLAGRIRSLRPSSSPSG